ncbi:AbiV family abortive infection protein [Pseudomonas jessenii]
MGNLIALTRENLRELDAIEGLASTLGADRIRALAFQLAHEYPVKIEEAYQSIPRQQHSSVIGMSDLPFEALRVACEVVISRVPELLRLPSYRYRHESRTTVPHGLWVALLERANEDILLLDPATSKAADESPPPDTITPFQDSVAENQEMLDRDFLLTLEREGLSATEAVERLIVHRRGIRDCWQDAELDK